MKKFETEGYFWFSFGGKADIGECHQIGKEESIDFPEEREIGYGATVRRGMEIADFSEYRYFKCTVKVSNPVTLTVEYASVLPTYPQDIPLQRGENFIEIVLPKKEITEAKLFVSAAKNLKLERTSFQVLEWTFE